MPNDFEKLLEEGSQYFERELSCKLHKVDGGRLAVTKFHDNIHDITLHLYFKNIGEIIDISVDMERVPYDICREAVPRFEEIVGLNVISHGALKQIREKIPRNVGCRHIYEMIETTIQAFFAAASEAYSKQLLGEKKGDEAMERQAGIDSTFMRDTCIAFNPELFKPESIKASETAQ